MYLWGGSGLSILSCPRTGTLAVSPHKASSALVHLDGGLWGALIHSHPSTKLVSDQRFQSLRVHPLVVGQGSGGWEGEINFLTLGWGPNFSFFIAPQQLCSWPNFQHCLVNQFRNRAAARGYPGTVPKNLIFP